MHKLLKRGFTLIELLIVIAIIGILAGLISTNLAGARSRARDARRKTDLDAISKSLRLYYNDTQSFPDSTNGEIDGFPWGSVFAVGETTYLNYLPFDPANSDESTVSYTYYSGNSDQFLLVAELENASDLDGSTSRQVCAGIIAVSGLVLGTNAYTICAQ